MPDLFARLIAHHKNLKEEANQHNDDNDGVDDDDDCEWGREGDEDEKKRSAQIGLRIAA